MIFKVALLLAFVAAASANDVNFRSCGAGYLSPQRVWSDQCTANLCTLRRGQVFTARAYFRPAETFNTLIVRVAATVFGINFPMTVPPGYEDACRFLGNGQSCPVHNGQDHVWELQFPVDPIYPLVNNLNVQRKCPLISMIRKAFNFLAFCLISFSFSR